MRRCSALPVAIAAAFSLVILYSCAPAGAGPQAWIDAPLDNTTVPLAPLTITAHASAAGGVASIEFTIDDQSYKSVRTNNGGRLEWRAVEWTPPGPGSYRIGARGVGNDGSTGPLATSVVTIADQMAQDEEEEEDIQVELPPPDELPPAVSSDAAEEPPEPEPVAEVPIAVARMNANCREGPGTSWDVYGNLLAKQRADLKGRLADNTWLLVHLLGRSLNCWIATSVVDVQGDLDEVAIVPAPLPPAPPPDADVLPPEPIESDTTPPKFLSVGANPSAIGIACAPTTLTIAAAVGDDVGLSSVTAQWSIGGDESGEVAMSLGGLGYWATIGPVHSEGTMRIRVVAVDTSGNSATSSAVGVGVEYCP